LEIKTRKFLLPVDKDNAKGSAGLKLYSAY